MQFKISNILHLTFRTVLMIPMSLIMGACSDDVLQDVTPPTVTSDGTITLTGSLLIPDMPDIMTRGAMADTPNNNLKLTILEFDKGDDESKTFLANVYKAPLTSVSGVANGGTVSFKVTLKAANTPKVLHLMIGDNYFTPDYGSVATVLPSLSVGNSGGVEREAYWGMVEFPDGFSSINDDGEVVANESLKESLTKVPVIRNFAKITVSENLNNFELLGFELINVPTSGTVAPWNSFTLTVPQLENNGEMLSYSAIKPIYSGILAPNAQFRNTEVEAATWIDGDNSSLRSSAARFVYEHPYESTRPTYLIINGNYRDPSTNTWKQGFYKIDIGKLGDNGMFEYYNIIRNIRYNVVLQSVEAPGCESVNEAISRAPFNNLLATTTTSSMLNVSDGTNMLLVNKSNHIFVKSDATVDIMYRYLTDITGTKQESNDVPTVIGLEPGEVIQSVGQKEVYTDPSGANWVKYTITPKVPTGEMKTQDFTIVDGNGLGRTVHLVLRIPWQYVPISAGGNNYTATIANGLADIYQGAPEVISAEANKPLTVYFNLPDGLPESIFPLEFKLEAKNQGIENNKIGNMVVSYGESLWNPEQIAISYIKTVSYSEYKYNYITGTNNIDINSPNTKHTIRCRFLTITATTDNNAAIMIQNDYFLPNAQVNFIRE